MENKNLIIITILVALAAFGQANSDGSVSAQTIQINPQELKPGNPNQ